MVPRSWIPRSRNIYVDPRSDEEKDADRLAANAAPSPRLKAVPSATPSPNLSPHQQLEQMGRQIRELQHELSYLRHGSDAYLPRLNPRRQRRASHSQISLRDLIADREREALNRRWKKEQRRAQRALDDERKRDVRRRAYAERTRYYSPARAQDPAERVRRWIVDHTEGHPPLSEQAFDSGRGSVSLSQPARSLHSDVIRGREQRARKRDRQPHRQPRQASGRSTISSSTRYSQLGRAEYGRPPGPYAPAYGNQPLYAMPAYHPPQMAAQPFLHTIPQLFPQAMPLPGYPAIAGMYSSFQRPENTSYALYPPIFQPPMASFPGERRSHKRERRSGRSKRND